MRVRYRPAADRLYLRLEGEVDDEPRVWKLLQVMGVQVGSEAVPGTLEYRRFCMAAAFPKLERALRTMRWELLPEEGEAPVSAAPERASYEAARPFDVAAVLREARADPVQGAATLAEAFGKLDAWARSHPGWEREARKDLAALAAGLQTAEQEARRRAQEEQAAASRDLAEQLRGVAGEDAFAAHAALKRLQEAARKAEMAAPAPLPVDLPERIAHFRGKLRPYQVEGVKFLLRRGLNAILADDMGLGKTVMAIAAIEAADERALVVGPANVLYNWKDEVERFTDEPAALFHQGRLLGPRDARFLVTTYDALQRIDRVGEQVAARPVLVLDEAHYVRNPETLRSQLVRALPQRRRLLLTGTPLVNTIEDYYELLRIVEPDRWGSRSQFRDTWLVDPVLFNKYTQVRSATATLLQRAARDVMLRRRKDDVLTELPPRTVSVLHHELAPDQLVAYRQLEARAEETFRRDARNELAVLAALHGLRHHLAVSRIAAALERVRELRAAGESVVVYSHYLEPLHALKRELGAEAAVLEGATPPKERVAMARRLGREGHEHVLLAQMEAGGVGLNFTGARHVLFVHFGWTPAVHAQAMDRVHRIGQGKPVFVEFFVTPDTIDERMVRILLRKEADQNLVLADESDLLNRAQVAELLAEDAAKRVAALKAASAGGAAPGPL